MKHKIIGGLALTTLLVFAGFSLAGAAGTTSYTVAEEYSTVTYKVVMDTDSLEALGHHHYSDGALKTAWLPVPVGIDFLIFVENRDSDSTLAYGPDTVNVALETAPYGGLAYDSAAAVHKYQKGNIIWKLPVPTFHGLQGGHQHYFWRGFGDSTAQASLAVAAAAVDTAAIEATSLKGNGINDLSGGGTVRSNLGWLRFSLSVDAADSVLDALVRLNCYIVFQNPGPGAWSFSSVHDGTGETYAKGPEVNDFNPRSYAYVPRNAPWREDN